MDEADKLKKSAQAQAIEDEFKLSDWSQARRVVVVMPHDEVQDHAQLWEYTVLVTHASHEIAAIEHVKAAAQQLPKIDRWRVLLAHICQRIVGQIGLPTPPPTLAEPG